MPRELLVHLNVEVPDEDTRESYEIAEAIANALSFVQFEIVDPEDTANLTDLKITIPLHEFV